MDVGRRVYKNAECLRNDSGTKSLITDIFHN